MAKGANRERHELTGTNLSMISPIGSCLSVAFADSPARLASVHVDSCFSWLIYRSSQRLRLAACG